MSKKKVKKNISTPYQMHEEEKNQPNKSLNKIRSTKCVTNEKDFRNKRNNNVSGIRAVIPSKTSLNFNKPQTN